MEDATHLCNAQFSSRTRDLVQRLKRYLQNNSAQTINQIDRNNGCYLERNELAEYLKQDGVPSYEVSAAVTSLLFEFDRDHDGKLSILDFLNR